MAKKRKQTKEVIKSIAPVAGSIAVATFNLTVAVGGTAANAASSGVGGTAVGIGAALIGDVFNVGKAIYQIAQDAKQNKKQSLRLADSVAILCQAVQGLDVVEVNKGNYDSALKSMVDLLNQCHEFIEEFQDEHKVIRFLKSGSHKEKFQDFQERLMQEMNQLQVGLGAQTIRNLAEHHTLWQLKNDKFELNMHLYQEDMLKDLLTIKKTLKQTQTQTEQTDTDVKVIKKYLSQLNKDIRQLKNALSKEKSEQGFSLVGQSGETTFKGEVDIHKGDKIKSQTGYEDGLVKIMNAAKNKQLPSENKLTAIVGKTDKTTFEKKVSVHEGNDIEQIESEASKKKAETDSAIALHQAGLFKLKVPKEIWAYQGIKCTRISNGKECTYYEITVTLIEHETLGIMELIQEKLKYYDNEFGIENKTRKTKQGRITTLCIKKEDIIQLDGFKKLIENIIQNAKPENSNTPKI